MFLASLSCTTIALIALLYHISNLFGSANLIRVSINFKAKVPGCVIEGLINENIIDRDVFWRDNAKAVKDYEKYNWLYSKQFELKDVTSGASITFERLDTYCDIFLNGKHLAKCENGFISHTFSVDGFLKNGTNLKVTSIRRLKC